MPARARNPASGGKQVAEPASSHMASPVRSDDSDSGDDYDADEAKVDHVPTSIPLTSFGGNSHAAENRNDEDDFDGEVFELSKRRGSNATDETFMLYTPDEEQAVIQKFDRRLVLFVALLYLLSFLDRSNIGNAKIAGLSRDLQLSSSQYEWLLRAFYLTYIAFEWMTLLYRVFPPHIYIATCVASWGLIASLQALASSFPFLLFLRFLLGISEAAFGPGAPFYLSFFYKRNELALRTGFFISAAPLATSFAASLAWLITKTSDIFAVAPWRMLFLVEGFPSVIVAVFAWHYLPDSPETAIYLTRRQKRVARLRLRMEKSPADTGGGERGLRWREIWETLIDPKSYLTASMFFCCNVAFSSLPVFLPTIIEEMGHSSATSQALAAPPYLFAFAAVLLTSWLSDRYRDRSLFVCFHALLAGTGYAIMAVVGSQGEKGSVWWRYAGVYPAAMGFFSAITIIITWTINNQDSDSKKGAGVAMLNVIGQLGPLVGTHLYPASDGPYYVSGMAICAGFMVAVAALSVTLRFILKRKNRRAGAGYMPVGEEGEALAMEERKGARRQFEFML